MTNQNLGQIGEDIAAHFLCSQGYHIHTQNFRWRQGEIDIIAIKKDQLAFIEVKARRSTRFGSALESITRQKRQKLIKTALHFLQTSKEKLPKNWRIDLIAVQFNSSKQPEITHIKNI